MAKVQTGIDDDFQTAMGQLIGARWRELWKALPAVIKSEDPEAVHAVRVASRRLRAVMDASTDAFPQKWYRSLHKTAKSITSALGDVRDRDVLLESLRAERADAETDPAEWLAIDHLIARFERERTDARKTMHDFLEDLLDRGVKKESRRRFPRISAAKARKKAKAAAKDAARAAKQRRRRKEKKA